MLFIRSGFDGSWLFGGAVSELTQDRYWSGYETVSVPADGESTYFSVWCRYPGDGQCDDPGLGSFVNETILSYEDGTRLVDGVRVGAFHTVRRFSEDRLATLVCPD